MTDSQQPTWLDAALTKTLAGEPVQNISVNHPDISMDEAYALQHELVGKLRDHGGWGEIYGYKAALTALPAQQAMGITEPIIGVLFERAVFPADGATTIKTDRPVLLETEVGFTLGKPITEPVTEHNVLDAVAYCSGLIELASPNLQQRPTSVDLISNNSASYGCVVGVSNKHPTDIDLDAVPVTLTRLASADEVLHTAAAGSVMAGQVDALIWLINSTLAQGYALRPGHVLVTGSIGSMPSGKAGKYRADFGALGDLAFVLD